MCGIGGYIHLSRTKGFPQRVEDNLAQALKSLERRGPDHQEIYRRDKVILCHARLSILDPEARSNQPMISKESGAILIFNGEIYNYRALREELISKGLTFDTNGDTEVLLKLLDVYGKRAIDKLNGFFAFTYHNPTSEYTLIARDRFGIKPLVIHQNEAGLLFASEIKFIKRIIDLEIDESQIPVYFEQGFIPEPNTIYRDVSKLPAGSLVEIIDGKIQQEQYFVPSASTKFNGSSEEGMEALRSALKDSVNMRLVSDVPLGCFLSGGIDSSVIALIASQSNSDITAYTVSFPENPWMDESEMARTTAAHLGIRAETIEMSNSDLLGSLPEVLEYLDEPFADSSCLPFHGLSKAFKAHATVALSGDGADELLGGYNRHAAAFNLLNPGLKERTVIALGPIWKSLPKSRNARLPDLFRKLDKFARAGKLSRQELYRYLSAYTSSASLEQFLITKDRPYVFPGEGFDGVTDDMEHYLLTDQINLLPNDMLKKVDLMSMANSLEVRVPFLDHNVASLINSFPTEWKIGKNGRKIILRETFRDELPGALFNQRKMGFEVPLQGWFTNELKELVKNELLDEKLFLEQGYFDPVGVRQLWNKLNSSSPDNAAFEAWSFIVFQHWYKKTNGRATTF